MTKKSSTRTQAERAELTRGRILSAAVDQFAEHGLSGARTEAIAEAAGVNKALLYYYFKSKDALYNAALELVADDVRLSNMAVLESDGSAGQRFLVTVLSHFDRIHSNQSFQGMMQHELFRIHRGEQNEFSPMVGKVMRPLMESFHVVLAEGVATGELIDADPMQIYYSALGSNVFYFLSAPVIGMVMKNNLLEPAGLEKQRRQTMEFLGQSIFVDRAKGMELAHWVLEQNPMPVNSGEWLRVKALFHLGNMGVENLK